MKQFIKIATAAFIGIAVYDACSDAVQFLIRKCRNKKSGPPNYREYDPKGDGRRSIGFKMQGEE